MEDTDNALAAEVRRLRTELGETRELAILSVKASISALSALEQVLKMLGGSSPQDPWLKPAQWQSAKEHVAGGLAALKTFIEGGEHDRQ